ncbi:MAG TPA: TIGR00341 family protein [Methanomassiliicoccales archaeon]|nr:TIGR00341 family protein [Methanomassiliicoccales archaeon]
MALRIVEVILESGNEESVRDAVKDIDVVEMWCGATSKERLEVHLLVKAENSEALVDALGKAFDSLVIFRLLILPVEATLPRVEEPPKEEPVLEVVEEPKNGEKNRWIKRISREELQEDVEDSSDLNLVYLITVILSVLVAAIGLLKDNVAVVIGAMVIAPLLGPNVAMSLATSLGDNKMIAKSAKTLLAGIFLALSLSVIIGMIFTVDPTVPEIAYRTNIDLSDVVLALASGAAGALFFTIGTSTALVGVMVAVALLPPLVVMGMLLGSGQFNLAYETLLLFMTNFICVNLAGVAVFVAQGVKPSHWWHAALAKKSVSYALLVWVALLIIMIILLLFFS